MLQFTQQPPQFAPLGSELRYVVESSATTTFDIRIIDASLGCLIGAKRFVGVKTATFDVAPYLRRLLQFAPVAQTTGLFPAEGRVVKAFVEVETAEEGVISSDVRLFLPAAERVWISTILTTMPRSRLISEGECDELTLVTNGSSTVTVTAQTGESLLAESFPIADAGVWIFRLAIDDYVGAESLTVDAGSSGTVVYTVVPRPAAAHRVAWRSRSGSIEHYTFPVERSEVVKCVKRRALSAEGEIVGRSYWKRFRRWESAYEAPEMAQAVAEVIASPQVWEAVGEGYLPLDVVTEESVVRQLGELSMQEITVCDTRNNRASWN